MLGYVEMQLAHTLSRLAAPRFDSKLEVRRGQALDWLRFIRDFGNINTTPLIERAILDDDFVDAIEAVAATGADAATAYDALRGFAVQLLLREARPAETHTGARLSPYSVPSDLLRGAFESSLSEIRSRCPFNPRRLSIGSWQGEISHGKPWGSQFLHTYMGLLTTIWCSGFPAASRLAGDLELLDTNTNRAYCVPLIAASHEHAPLFVSIGPGGSFEVRLRNTTQLLDSVLCVLVEGWVYSLDP